MAIIKKIKENNLKALNRLKMLDALKKLQLELIQLGPVPYNVDYKTIYSDYHGMYFDNVSVPRDNSLYDYLIKYFNIMSKFQDKEIFDSELFKAGNSESLWNGDGSENKSENGKKLWNIYNLKQHISNSGRCEYGLNRTKKGEIVTEDNVYLGNIFGMNTNTIKFWKNYKSNSQERTDAIKYFIQIYQVKGYLDSHIDYIKELISEVLKQEENTKNSLYDKIALKKFEKIR